MTDSTFPSLLPPGRPPVRRAKPLAYVAAIPAEPGYTVPTRRGGELCPVVAWLVAADGSTAALAIDGQAPTGVPRVVRFAPEANRP